ncbi:ATP-binding protein [Nonomuraea monospora]|uniref:ATP-binding protein n=1 Tax=Nonomuraea monospora TaxID=568818 RepID=A0ABN3CZ28_9ACTN
MLIRFEVANFRSMLDPVELSMMAIDRSRAGARPLPGLCKSLLPVAAIFGPNASGKSNVIAAIAWLREAVRESLRLWDDEIPVEPFAFAEGRKRLSEFTVEYAVSGVRYAYAVALDRQAVHYEALFHYSGKNRRRIFERDAQHLKLQRGLGNLSGTRRLLTPRTLALSIARRFDEPMVSRFADHLLAGRTLGLPISGPPAGGTMSWLDPERPDMPSQADRAQALELLRFVDPGIDDVLIEGPRTRRRTRLVHRTAEEKAALDFAQESEGMRAWFDLIGPVLGALKAGSLLLFDGSSEGLHPTLSMRLLALFRDPVTNPEGAQMVFTSHDAGLLDHLSKDEVWLAEKADGATRLGAAGGDEVACSVIGQLCARAPKGAGVAPQAPG